MSDNVENKDKLINFKKIIFFYLFFMPLAFLTTRYMHRRFMERVYNSKKDYNSLPLVNGKKVIIEDNQPYKRKKPHIVFCYTVIFNVFIILIWFIVGAEKLFINSFSYLLDKEYLMFSIQFLILPILVNLIVGSLLGFFFCYRSDYIIKNKPYFKNIEGTWQKNHHYDLTFYEKKEKEKAIKSLKNDDSVNNIINKYNLQDYEQDIDVETRSLIDNEEYAVALNKDTNEYIYRSQDLASRHTIIVGGSGSGKTVTEKYNINQDSKLGKSIVWLDFKNDIANAYSASEICRRLNMNFYHLSSAKEDKYNVPSSLGQCYYDPFKGIEYNKIQDVLTMIRKYDTSAAIYEQAHKNMLTSIFNIWANVDFKKLRRINEEKTLIAREHNVRPDIIDLDSGVLQMIKTSFEGVSRVKSLVASIDDTKNSDIKSNGDDFINILSKKSNNNHIASAYEQMNSALGILTNNSGYGQWLRKKNNAREIDLMKLVNQPGNFVLFSLPGDAEESFSKPLGNIILGNIIQIVDYRRTNEIKNPVALYIDEFQTLPLDNIKKILEKARNSNIGATLSMQSLNQIIINTDKNGEAELGNILETCNNFYIHSGISEDKAIFFSKLFPKEYETKISIKGSVEDPFLKKIGIRFFDVIDEDRISRTDVEEYKYKPQFFIKDLQRGEAVIIDKQKLNAQKGTIYVPEFLVREDRKYFEKLSNNEPNHSIYDSSNNNDDEEDIEEYFYQTPLKESQDLINVSEIMKNSDNNKTFKFSELNNSINYSYDDNDNSFSNDDNNGLSNDTEIDDFIIEDNVDDGNEEVFSDFIEDDVEPIKKDRLDNVNLNVLIDKEIEKNNMVQQPRRAVPVRPKR